MRPLALLVLLCAVAPAACSREAEAPTTTQPAQQSATSKMAVAAMPRIESQPILEHIKVLSADDFEGRLPGTPGEEKTVQYLEKKFAELGLKPGNTDGTFVQKVPLVGLTPSETEPLVVSKGAQKRTFKWSDDYVAFTKHVADTAGLANTEMVFVGYGVVAPEYNWDDFKGLDVKGK